MKHPAFSVSAAAVLVLSAGLSGCSLFRGTACEFREPTVPLIENGRTAERARGVWRSRGYGVVLSVSEDGARLFHETKAGCYPDPLGEEGMLAELAFVDPEVNQAPDVLSLASLPGETRYVFDKLGALPEACAAASASWSPPRLFDLFVATFSEHYGFFEEYEHPWKERVAALRPKVTDATEPRALFAVFTELLKGLDDAHTGLSAEVDGETLDFSEGQGVTTKRVLEAGQKAGLSPKEAQRAWMGAWREGVLQTVLKSQGHVAANNRVMHGLIDGDIGYLNILTMGGLVEGEASLEEERRALNEALDEALKSFHHARAVIVDVSNNRGGYDVIGRDIAARFTSREARAYTKRPRNVDVKPQAFLVEPTTRARFLGPVYVVTSDITVSAGEVFTLSMRALPNVTHVGTATRGAFSDVLVKPLPNGWRMELSNEEYLDAEGKLFEARGIPPEEPLDVFPADDLNGGHARAVLKLAALASERAPKRHTQVSEVR
ncbi:S41 family peptidase [Pyxidicoccus fallax]|uniref:S41 family peptidase n=1 Tax=Pyxidicoccus fallax TaxID=394095 RepID=A0A848L6Y5_9BACT|nr:S41 family peptidase [Pyxidicoccus fallax]NMO14287.1 S41 family peptidase [Pyxidicoccus fallax]NPC79908.1 S41 family peptidase [Pyxidicoccus fallax]